MSKEVDPIEDISDVIAMYEVLTKWGKIREANLFVIGCNMALRISDLRLLRFDQLVKGDDTIREIKTKKGKNIVFNANVYNHVAILKEWYEKQHIKPVYLFQTTARNVAEVKPISRQYVWKAIEEAGRHIGLGYDVGTHTMRKTWGYNAYKNGMDIRQIQKMLNHSSSTTTLAYIGITKRKMKQAYHDYGISVL